MLTNSTACDNGTLSSMDSCADQEWASGWGEFPIPAIFVLLAIVILFLCILRSRRDTPGYVIRRMQSAARARRTKDPVKVKARYAVIEKELLSLQVHSHDEYCQALQRNDFRSSTKSLWRSMTGRGLNEGDDALCCAICFETFQVDDIVSMSPNTGCSHTYHHGCIKEWLLRDQHCPMCRATFLPSDLPEEQRVDENQAQPDCFYCQSHGLITLPCDTSQLDPIVIERAKQRPNFLVLATKRNEKCSSGAVDSDCSTVDDDLVDVELGESPAMEPVAGIDERAV